MRSTFLLLILAVSASAAESLDETRERLARSTPDQMRLTVEVPRRPFVLGEPIPLTVRLRNMTGRKIDGWHGEPRWFEPPFAPFLFLEGPGDSGRRELPRIARRWGRRAEWFSLAGEQSASFDLTDWAPIAEPGRYRLFLAGAMHIEGGGRLTVASGIVTVEVGPAGDGWREAAIARAREEIAGEDAAVRAAGVSRLGRVGDAASLALLRGLLEDPDVGERAQWCVVRHPDAAAARAVLEDGFARPDVPVGRRYLEALATLGESDDEALLARLGEAIAGKTGRAAAAAVPELLLSGVYPDALPAAAARAWPDLSDVDRLLLLRDEGWPHVRSPELAPLLKAVLDGPIAAAEWHVDHLPSLALLRWSEFEPEAARARIIEDLRRPHPLFTRAALLSLPDETLPDLEPAWSAALADREGRALDKLAPIVERYATARMRPAVKALYESAKGRWACEAQEALLGYLLKHDRPAGLAAVREAVGFRGEAYSGCYRTVVGRVLGKRWGPDAEALAVPLLEDPDPDVRRDVVETLVRHGSRACREPLAAAVADVGRSDPDLAERFRRRFESSIVRVLAAADDAPIAGARVAVVPDEGDDVEGVTDDEGRAIFPELPAGRARVKVDAPGYVPAFARRRLRDGVALEVRLLAGVRVHGRILAAETDRPIGGASVRVILGGAEGRSGGLSIRPALDEVVTDGDGRFETRTAPAGQLVTVIATAPRFAKRDATVSVPATGEPPPAVLRLPAAGRIAGLVVGPDGRPVEGARVYSLPADAPSAVKLNPRYGFALTMRADDTSEYFRAKRTETDAAGRFAFASVPFDRPHLFLTERDGLARSDWSAPAAVTRDGPEREIVLRLRTPARLTVIVLGPDGPPVDGARVGLSRLPSTGNPGHYGETGRNGRIVFDDVPPGRVRLYVRKPGLLGTDRRLEVAEGETRSLALRLSAGAAVSGRVVDDTGSPVPHARVRVWRDGSESDLPESGGWTESDAEGRFTVSALRDGPHHARAEAGGHEDATAEIPNAEAAEPIRLVLERHGTVVFRLKLPEGGPDGDLDLEDIEVYAVRDEPYAGGYGDVGAEGEGLRAEDVVAGPVRLEIAVPGYAPALATAVVPPGGSVRVGEIALSRGFALAGRVVDTAGRPVAGAEVAVAASPENNILFYRFADTDEDGRFRVEHLAPGRLEFSVEAEGFVDREILIEIRGEDAEIPVTLTPRDDD